MGQSNSSSSASGGGAQSRELTAEQQRQIAWAMPAFCVEKYEITPQTTELVYNSWEYMMSGRSPPFLLATASEPSLIPVTFFYNKFYSCLFELAPDAKPLFTHGLAAQGRMLASMIKFVCSSSKAATGPNAAAEGKLLVSSLQHLARIHNKISIGAGSYSIMGVVLLHTMQTCVGDAYWSAELKTAWTMVFSKMMAVMIPVVVANELPSERVRKVSRCPATGASGVSPHGSPNSSPPRAKRSASGSEELVYDYRRAAERMQQAEEVGLIAPERPAAATAASSGKVASAKSADATGPSFLQPDVAAGLQGDLPFNEEADKLL